MPFVKVPHYWIKVFSTLILDEIVKTLNNPAMEVKSLPFTNYAVGNNTNLVLCGGEARIGFFNSLTNITVVPFLHTN